MSERLLRGVYPEHRDCVRNDNAPYGIKGIARVIARGLFRSNLPLSQWRIGCGFSLL